MNNRSIRIRLFIISLLIVVMAAGLLTFLNLQASSHVLREQIKESSSKSLFNIKTNYETEIRRIRTDMAEIYTNTDFIQDLSDDVSLEVLQARYRTIARAFSSAAFDADQLIEALYFYTADHECISYYRRADTPTIRYPKDIYVADSEADYNSIAVKKYVESDRSEILMSSYYNPYRERNLIRFVSKIYVENRGRLVGYMVCDMNDRSFENRIKTYTYYDRQIIAVQPVGDRVAVSVGTPAKNQDEILLRAEETVLAMEAERYTTLPIDVVENGKIFSTASSRYGVVFLSMYPEDVIRDNQRSLVVTLVLLLLIILIATMFFAWIISGYFNSQYMLKQKNADFRALQAQINPHFLYNTLAAMSSIARKHDCAEVSDLSLALSDMFRYSMNVKEPFVLLQQEADHLRNYLYVITTRMQKKIQVEFAIKPEHMGIRMPRMILQPIAENAIKHGLSEARGEKRLSISSEEKDGKVVVTVADNGIGMDAEYMNRWMEQPEDESIESRSIGMQNIHARLRNVYGQGYGLQVESNETGSKVHILLKKESS